MKLSGELAARLPLEDIVTRARVRVDDFFPSRAASLAIATDAGAPTRIRSLAKRDYQPSRSEIVEVPKWSGASRPVVDLTVVDRVLYDALVEVIRSAIPEGIVQWTPGRVERLELENEIATGDSGYVLLTDVHAYYEHVDHRLLETELVELSAEDEAVDALIDLLRDAQGRETGLPQGPRASKTLGDIYLSVVDRAMIRDGVKFLRFSDDYRIPSATWREARRRQIRLEHLLRGLGLTVSAGKTFTPTRDTYADWLAALRRQPHVRADPFSFEYGEQRDRPAPGRRAVLGAEATVREISDHPQPWGSNYDQSVQLLEALSTLAIPGSNIPIERSDVLFRSFPHLTKEFSRYLRGRMGKASERAAVAAVAALVSADAHIFDWQLGWLYHAVIPALFRLPRGLIDRANESLRDGQLPWFVRGRAAVLLSTEGELPDRSELGRIIEDAPEASVPDFVAAMVNGEEPADALGRLGPYARDPLSRSVATFVAENGVAKV